MKHFTRKFLALMLSLSMVLSTFSVAYADDTDGDTVIVMEDETGTDESVSEDTASGENAVTDDSTGVENEDAVIDDGYDSETGEYDTVINYNEDKTASDKAAKDDLTEDTAAKATTGTVITGTFEAIEGYDVTTIRYYTDADRTAYAFADFTKDSNGNYTYSFEAPYDGFKVEQASETTINKLDETSTATVVAAYYTVDKWDGAIDVTWYDAGATEYHIYTPAQLAGVAAIVNGSIDSAITNVNVKGYRSDLSGAANEGMPDCIQHEHKDYTSLTAKVYGPADVGLESNDFANKTIYLEADMDMGGVDGNYIDQNEVMYSSNQNIGNLHDGKHEGYDYYPNWMPIGGLFLRDVSDNTTAVISYFNGTFDGNGHYVNNLYCNRWSMRKQNADGSYDSDYVAYGYSDSNGFIGRIGTAYTESEVINVAPAVRNLGLTGFVFGRRSVGGIVGKASSGSYYTGNVYLENLVNEAVVYATDKFGIGGILGAGFGSGYIINCYNKGRVRQFETENSGGGIVGENSNMSIYCCYNIGYITTNEAGVYRGCGIGNHDDGGSDYTVDYCYYLEGKFDRKDSKYYGYYTENIPDSVSVNTEMMTASQMTDGTLLAKLNVNGDAYVAGSDGYPILAWEAGNTTGNLTVTKPEGGYIYTNYAEGTLKQGTVVYLSNSREDLWSFKYYMLNNKQITVPYVSVSATTEVSGKFLKSGVGYISIPNNPVVDVKVYKVTGGSSEEDYVYTLLNDGDSVYENDYIMISASIRDGVYPEDLDTEYSAVAGLDSAYTYTITYTGHDPISTEIKTFEVSDYINETNAVLTVEVGAKTTQKMWKYQADTSWYDKDNPKTSYTITTPYQLAGIDKLVEDEVTDFSGVTFKLGNDISLANLDATGGTRYWDGIGSMAYPFCGSFDGNGYSITDISGCAYGLFAYVKGPTTKNVEIKNLSVYGYCSGPNAAGFAGKTENVSLTDCDNYCVIDGDTYTGQSYVGGIVGQDIRKTIIKNCTNYAPVTGRYCAGGILGYSKITTSTIIGSYTDCVNLGDITCENANSGTTYCGGIAGYTTGTMTRCANYGDISSALLYNGGLAGGTGLSYKSVDSYNVGSVTYTGSSAKGGTGGLFGYALRFIVNNTYNYGNVCVDLEDAPYGSFAGTYTKNTANTTNNVYCIGADETSHMIGSLTISDLKALASADVAGINEAFTADFASASGVLAKINGNYSFVLNNSTYPEITKVAGLHTHSGGTATCVSGPKCEVCGLVYGDADISNHVNKEVKNQTDAKWIDDGYTGDTYCKDCGTLLEQGEVIKADTTQTAVTVYFTRDGETVSQKVYSIADFDALKSTDPIGFQYGSKFRTVCATNYYVKIEDILSDSGYTYNDILSVRVVCSSSSTTVTKAMLTTDNIYYYNEDADPTTVPPVISIKNSTGIGTIDKVLESVTYSPLRFMYGLSQEELDSLSAGGARLQSPVVALYVNLEDVLTGAVISGDIEGYAGDGNVDVSLKDSNGKTVAEKSVTGSYKIKNISKGDYTLCVSADGYVENEYVITVGTEADDFSTITQDVEIHTLGDINGDGKITSSDLLVLGRHVNGISTITNTYMLKLCDVNGDGNVTTADYTKLGRYISKLDNAL